MFFAEDPSAFGLHAKFDVCGSENDSDVEVDPHISLSAIIPVTVFLFYVYVFALERRGDVTESADVALAYIGRKLLPRQTTHDYMSLPFCLVVAWFDFEAVWLQDAIGRDRVTLGVSNIRSFCISHSGVYTPV